MRSHQSITRVVLLTLVAAGVLSAIPVAAHSSQPPVSPWQGPRRPLSIQWGLPGDVPVSGDFDGDGLADVAIFRPANGTWFLVFSSNLFDRSKASLVQWGLSGDVPMVGDYDGDGVTDLVVYRPSTGTWHLQFSNNHSWKPGYPPVARH